MCDRRVGLSRSKNVGDVRVLHMPGMYGPYLVILVHHLEHEKQRKVVFVVQFAASCEGILLYLHVILEVAFLGNIP